MTNVTVFFAGVGITALASFCAVAYLTPSLRTILIDLCGTVERANFWTAFSNLTLILMPLIFALRHTPDNNQPTPLALQLGTQMEWALVGLVTTVVVVGFAISRFIPRPIGLPRAPATGQLTPQGGTTGAVKPGTVPTGAGGTS